jgi:hypothetical protein
MKSPRLVKPYCTLEDVQRETQNKDTDDVPDFIEAINQASRFIDDYCRRDFLFHDHTTEPLSVIPSWCASNVIYLPWPVLTVTEVSISDGRGNVAVLSPDRYVIENAPRTSTGKIIKDGRWKQGDVYDASGLIPQKVIKLPSRIQIKGTFGYAPFEDTTPPTPNFDANSWPSPSIPMQIRIAAAVIAGVRSGKARREWTDVTGTRQSTTVKTVPKDTMDSLNRYRVQLV